MLLSLYLYCRVQSSLQQIYPNEQRHKNYLCTDKASQFVWLVNGKYGISFQFLSQCFSQASPSEIFLVLGQRFFKCFYFADDTDL